MSLPTSSIVSHYRIGRRLGAGGMGEVYLAEDTKLHRQVAIKFLVAPDDEGARRRLLREARAAAALDHPDICAVYEVGTDTARGDFVVMQYVEGDLLSDRLRRGGRLEPTEALRIAGEIAGALASAHGRGIVHRDLKPQNIIITPSGRPKLMDFGLAKRALTREAAAEAPTTAALTRPHAPLGTAGYMAPEQIRNAKVDGRADLFGLGCVLYECLTGQRAFPGPTSADMLGQVLHTEPPPPSSVVAGLDNAIDALCAHLLRKNVNERCQSAEEALGMIRALLPPGTSVPDTGRRSTSVWRSRWYDRHRRLVAGTAAGLAVLVVATIGGVEWRRRHALPQASPEAQKWFDRGVAAIREGTYAGARDSFEEAIRLDPKFPQAYARLADALSELDDERGAEKALVHVSDLVPNSSALDTDDRLQLEAVRASVLREHDRAIAAYKALAASRPTDASAWLDLGRAQEAADRLGDARASYTKALELDSQYAAAYVRLGSLQSTPRTVALSQFDEAARLYRTAADVEGEAQAELRKGIRLSNGGQYELARQALNQVDALTTDPRYKTERLQAHFEMARVAAFESQFKEAEDLGRQAVDEATNAGWQGLAANGLINLGSAIQLEHQNDAADQQFVRAIELASAEGARRTEMRARLQQASLRQFMGHPQEAITLTEATLPFFSNGHYVRYEAYAEDILSRADAELERYDEATRLAGQALAAAKAIDNDELVATALEDRAGELDDLGRLAEALSDRVQIEAIHRAQKDLARLPYDLANRAELLIELGRDGEAQQAIAEVEQGIAQGIPSYKLHETRVLQLRALSASAARRFRDVLKVVPAPAIAHDPASSDTLYLRVLVEHARARLRESTVPTPTIEGWLDQTRSPEFRRELAYWVSATLLARGETARASAVARAALADPAGRGNLELRWRLEALAAQAGSPHSDGASMAASARADLQRLGDQWGDLGTYLTRPDVMELCQAVR